DGDLPADRFSWSVAFHHDLHTHPFLDGINGVTSGSFTIPLAGETAPDQWYRIRLNVTDSFGATAEVTRDIHPRTAAFTLASNVAGIKLNLEGQPNDAPATVLGVVGMPRQLGAPLFQT